MGRADQATAGRDSTARPHSISAEIQPCPRVFDEEFWRGDNTFWPTTLGAHRSSRPKQRRRGPLVKDFHRQRGGSTRRASKQLAAARNATASGISFWWVCRIVPSTA